MTTSLIFILPKVFANPPLYSNLTSLKHTMSIKIIIMSLTAISLFLLCQTVGNFSLDLISPDSSNFSQTLQISLYPNFLLVYFLAPPPSAGSAKKLKIRAVFHQFSICTDEGSWLLAKLQYAICLIIYWLSKRCFSSLLFTPSFVSLYISIYCHKNCKKINKLLKNMHARNSLFDIFTTAINSLFDVHLESNKYSWRMKYSKHIFSQH